MKHSIGGQKKTRPELQDEDDKTRYMSLLDAHIPSRYTEEDLISGIK